MRAFLILVLLTALLVLSFILRADSSLRQDFLRSFGGSGGDLAKSWTFNVSFGDGFNLRPVTGKAELTEADVASLLNPEHWTEDPPGTGKYRLKPEFASSINVAQQISSPFPNLLKKMEEKSPLDAQTRETVTATYKNSGGI